MSSLINVSLSVGRITPSSSYHLKSISQLIIHLRLGAPLTLIIYLFQNDSVAESEPAPKDMTAVNAVSFVINGSPSAEGKRVAPPSYRGLDGGAAAVAEDVAVRRLIMFRVGDICC